MKVKQQTLLLLASLVWSVAGLNIFTIGLTSYSKYWSLFNLLVTVIVFVVFQKFVFAKLVQKHTARIHAYKEEKQFFLNFFDLKSFFIMAVMMSVGILLRTSGLASQHFIAVFYTGLGASLLFAGLLFGCNFGKAVLSARSFKTTR